MVPIGRNLDLNNLVTYINTNMSSSLGTTKSILTLIHQQTQASFNQPNNNQTVKWEESSCTEAAGIPGLASSRLVNPSEVQELGPKLP